MDHQLRDCRLKNADHQRLIDDIARQHDHGRMVLFLEHPEMNPTNNPAERGLRAAVIARKEERGKRKVSHCRWNEQGIRTSEAMKSVTATLAMRGLHVANSLAAIINGQPMPQALTR